MLGKFITIEGTDGSGKTTVTKMLEEYLLNKGYKVITTREPGGVDVSEKIRNIILFEDIDPKTEALLFAASRREHIIKKIIPALSAGYVVLCDRFLDSSIAYQVFGRNLDEQNVLDINSFALEGLEPDLTLYFDVDINTGLSRVSNRVENNNLDNEQNDFYIRVKKGYDYTSEKYQNRVVKINANNDINTVFCDSIAVVEKLLEGWK